MAEAPSHSISPKTAALGGKIPRSKPGFRVGRRLDWVTLTGSLGSFAMILLAIAASGSFSSFVDWPALAIVFGGTFLVTAISFTAKELWRTQKVLMRTVLYKAQDPGQAAWQIVALADWVRKRSPLELQKNLKDLQEDPFLHRALSLVVDGLPAEELENVLEREIISTQSRHQKASGILRRAGEVAPAMGLIGTLIGLVQMLRFLEEPSQIGPAMAVALLTTFYGAVLANMVFLPLASKLDRNSETEAQVKRIQAIGAISLSRQENPRRLEIHINTILPPEKRITFFD